MRCLGGSSLPLASLFVLGVCLISTVSARLAVMSIDLGGEFMKIAIVKPGVPMEIVLNKESSRKTHSIVAFREGERLFANDAFNTAVRFPDKAFWFLTHIIGRQYDDPMVQQYLQRFPFYAKVMMKDEERGTVLFRDPNNDDILYSAEELLGMLLEKAREYAQDFAEQEIKDVVITVPPYYNQAERRAVRVAAELVGLNVLQLMSDNAAVALNYGVFRRKNFNTTAQYYMFYDMGATSTVATIVSYQMVKTKEGTRVETNPQLTIKGVGYDRNLGGLEMTLRLRNHLAKVFNSRKKRSVLVQDNPRAMAKLLKEAERVKKVLSANADHKAQVEGLLDGEDFHAKVTRDELDEMNKDLLQRVTAPVEEALKSTEITMGEISEVILMGGSSRVPKVQELLLKYIGRSDLGKSINTDEAAALGAVYQAAYLGKGFKVKTFHVRDGNIYPINVEFAKQKKEQDDGSTAPRTIKRTLFGRMNPYPQKKVMTFNKHFTDFNFDVRYGDLDFLSEEERQSFRAMSLTNVSLVGVADALGKHKDDGAEYKGVKAHFRMDESGILSLDKVESVFEKQQPVEAAEKAEDESTWSKIGKTFGGLFGGKEEETAEEGKTETVESSEETPAEKTEEPTKKPDAEEKSAEDKKTEEDRKDKSQEKTGDKEPEGEKQDNGKTEKQNGTGEKATKDKEEKKKEETKEEKKPAAPKTVVLKEDIKAEIAVKDLTDMTQDRLKEAKKRLKALRKKDQEKMELEKAKNELEGYIFEIQDKLSQEVYEACSTSEEREKVLSKFSEASDWLYEQPDDAKKDVYVDKLKELRELMKNIAQRVFEKEERPKALEALKSHLNSTTTFLQTVLNMTDPEDPIFTEVELTTLGKLINETTQWRDEAVKEQEKLADHEMPSLLVETIGSKIYALEREMKYLINKAKNYRPKPKKDNSTAKANDTATEGAENKTETKSDGQDEKKPAADEAAKDDDENGIVQEEEEESSTITPESQEAPPETEAKDDKTENTIDAPDVESESKTEQKTEGKKRRPKKKREQEEVQKEEQEEVLELGSDDFGPAESKIEDPHEEL